MLRRLRQNWRFCLLTVAMIAGIGWYYVRTHPLVFMRTHAHCIKVAGLQLDEYASNHDGVFPFHPKGYPNALLLMDQECLYALTGPGYDATPLKDAKQLGKDLAEEDCGRVYVQGLTQKSNSQIALLFDKLPTPGGDHCHLPARLWASLGREVWLVGMVHIFVREDEWPDFTKNQIELLVQEGYDRSEAERLYASPPK